MTSAELKTVIMRALEHGALCLPEIAEQIDQAPFLVNGELKALRRERLVHDRFDRTAHVWELTDAGYRRLAHANQMQMRIV